MPRIELIGDTLPNALMDWTPEDWANVPTMDGTGGIVGFTIHPEERAKLEAGVIVPPLAVELSMEGQDKLFDHVKQNAKHAKRMVGGVPNTHTGKTVAICGAGPSLREYLNEHPRRYADQVWACNSAVPYLMGQGMRVTHAVGVDQSVGMLDDWRMVYPALEYMIASSVHPRLVRHLQRHNIRVRWFHNYLGLHDPEGWTPPIPGLAYEIHLYQTLYQASCCPAYGLNVVARAIGLALYMGFSHILVYGSDCAAAPDSPPMPSMDSPDYVGWAKQVQIYADGRTVFDVYGPRGFMMEAGGRAFKGRRWHTRADMMITARHLVDMVKGWNAAELVTSFMGNMSPHE